MAQTQLVLNTLKHCLKEKNLTYVDVAKALSLSEASIKRIFSEKNISLHRLDIICQLLGMELTDLMRRAEKQQEVISELTLEQEQEFLKKTQTLVCCLYAIKRL
ncbi:MAG: helix-turn-helix transcriptional regulator [Enterobacterales bacterium]|nr:helix-turn-helix transcriptional regulator [Enterobacterales bacterium]